jgi:hypothetical protein
MSAQLAACLAFWVFISVVCTTLWVGFAAPAERTRNAKMMLVALVVVTYIMVDYLTGWSISYALMEK